VLVCWGRISSSSFRRFLLPKHRVVDIRLLWYNEILNGNAETRQKVEKVEEEGERGEARECRERLDRQGSRTALIFVGKD